MSANPSVSLASKNACNPSQTPSPSQSQSGSFIGSEGNTQRRVGGSGSFGTASTSRSISSTARNNQSLRKQHKGQRRPRLADEDAAAESVSRPHDPDAVILQTMPDITMDRRPCSLPVVGKAGLR